MRLAEILKFLPIFARLIVRIFYQSEVLFDVIYYLICAQVGMRGIVFYFRNQIGVKLTDSGFRCFSLQDTTSCLYHAVYHESLNTGATTRRSRGRMISPNKLWCDMKMRIGTRTSLDRSSRPRRTMIRT
jgi:hypothetical protein